MDHGMNRTEGPPLTQCNSGKLFSLNTAHEAQFSVINDGVSSYKIQSPSDSFNIALEILNGVGIAQSDKLLPSSQVGFDLFSPDSNASMDLQTLAQRLYGLTTGLPDATLRDLATISHFLTREKSSLNTLEPTTAATTSLATAATTTTTTAMLPEDHITGRATLSGTGFGRLCSVDSFSGTNEQALNQLTHWSNALSNAPPSVVKAFQHAQAQMALLGLSSPHPNESADPRSTNREVANRTRTMTVTNDSSTMEAINLSRNGITEIESSSLKNGSPMDTDVTVPGSMRDSVHDKSESNSKVIIRQTADADEHFFKALRQLKVDVSADIQTVDRRSSVGLIMGPEPASTTTSTAIGLLTNENRWDAHSSSTRLVQPKISKSATELAVEEHFEKSLAAFNASKRNKNCLVEVHRANSNACTMPLAVSVGTPAKEAARLSTMTPCPASLDMSAGKSCTQRSNIPCLVRQCAQDHTSPQLGSAFLPTVDSPSYAPRTLLSPGPEECQSSNFSLSSSASLSRNNSFGMVNSPGESGSSTRVLQPVATCCTSLPTTSSSNVSTNNSFKPKKNWLAQYDWRQDARDNSTLSLTASNCIVHGAVDSAGSSPASIGLELPDTNSTSNGHRWITSSNRAPLKSSRGENVIEHEVSVQTMESIGLSTDDRPITERKTRHSAEIQTDALLIHTLSENQDAFSDDGPQNFSNEVPSEDMRPTKILLLEKIRDDDALTRPPMDSTRCGEYPAQAGKQIQVQSKRFVKTLRRDLALSPIFQDHGISGETAAMEKGSGSDRSPQYQSDCVPPKSTECHELPTQFHPSHNDAISGSGSNARNGKCSLWGLSNSCSPSPAHQDGSATSAVTPVSGTTSGFFTGSTYSLDSSLGTAHTIPFDTKEVDSGIDLKSVSEERNFHPDHEALPDSDEAGRIPHPADLPGCAWGMRKRASSEASPWSTLKRSRSVLTSPLTGRVNCASCSSSSAELLLEAHVDETIGNTNSCRLRRLDGGSICRCCEGQNRPLTPDLNGSYAFDGHDRMLSPSESNSGLNDKCLQEENHKHFVGDDDDNDDDDDDDENADQVLNERSRGVLSSVPELYPMHKTFTVCDYKQSSESTCLTQNRSGNRSIGRSLSDAGVIPILHLTKEKDVFVLR